MRGGLGRQGTVGPQQPSTALSALSRFIHRLCICSTCKYNFSHKHLFCSTKMFLLVSFHHFMGHSGCYCEEGQVQIILPEQITPISQRTNIRGLFLTHGTSTVVLQAFKNSRCFQLKAWPLHHVLSVVTTRKGLWGRPASFFTPQFRSEICLCCSRFIFHVGHTVPAHLRGCGSA